MEFEKEMGIMGVMSHENIVRFLGISSTALPVLIVMEVMSNGPLNTFVMKLGMRSFGAADPSARPPFDSLSIGLRAF